MDFSKNNLIIMAVVAVVVVLVAGAGVYAMSGNGGSAHKVVFDGNGGYSGSDHKTVIESNTDKALGLTFEKEGYTQTCWNTAKDGSGTYYEFDAKVDKSMTLYAIYGGRATITMSGNLSDLTNLFDIVVKGSVAGKEVSLPYQDLTFIDSDSGVKVDITPKSTVTVTGFDTYGNNVKRACCVSGGNYYMFQYTVGDENIVPILNGNTLEYTFNNTGDVRIQGFFDKGTEGVFIVDKIENTSTHNVTIGIGTYDDDKKEWEYLYDLKYGEAYAFDKPLYLLITAEGVTEASMSSNDTIIVFYRDGKLFEVSADVYGNPWEADDPHTVYAHMKMSGIFTIEALISDFA